MREEDLSPRNRLDLELERVLQELLLELVLVGRQCFVDSLIQVESVVDLVDKESLYLGYYRLSLSEVKGEVLNYDHEKMEDSRKMDWTCDRLEGLKKTPKKD